MAMPYLDRLKQHAAEQGDRPAIASAAQGWTYGQLLQAVQQRMAALDRAGIAPGHTIGLQVADEAEHLILALALLGLGTRQITLASFDADALHAQIALRAGVTHRLDDQDALALKQQAGPGLAQPPTDRPGGLYLKTSGTTGNIQIVPFTEAQVAAQAERHAEYAHERLLRLASFEHNNSKRHRLYCVWAGGTNVFKPPGHFDLPAFLEAQRVTCLDISRMHAADLAGLPASDRFRGIKIRTGGSAVPHALRARLEQAVTAQLYVRYATTESGAIAMARPGQHSAEEGVGQPLAGVRLEIVNADDQPLPTGEIGQVRLQAAGLADGYLDAPDDTNKRFRSGWFYPGDLGLLKPDGTLVLQGRTDDMIILNGLNIYPAEIERALETHPAIRTAAALGLPSAIHGQIPVAAVELHPGSSLDLAELKQGLRLALGLKAPRRILQLEALPRNQQGKVLKRALLALFNPPGPPA